MGIGPADGPARTELALWLWEVHNSVNARLRREAAQRQNRNVTHEETLASRFPKKMCPQCWKDDNMTQWDDARVFRFLDAWYWPDLEPANEQFTAVSSNIAEGNMWTNAHGNFRSDAATSSAVSSSRMGMAFASLLCLVAVSLLVVTAAIKARRERRKKFVDSRFVKKKQGCF